MTHETLLPSTDWSWLANTYWYVPEPSLPALQYDPSTGTLAWMIDQTVWHITGCAHGYFWGATAVLLQPASGSSSGQAQPVGMVLLGTITPGGGVQLTFIRTGAQASGSATIGTGKLLMSDGASRFLMQMSSGNSDRTLNWAEMLQTSPGETSWASLPGAGISVEQMLKGIDPPSFAAPAR
jgi:hypothetical protein